MKKDYPQVRKQLGIKKPIIPKVVTTITPVTKTPKFKKPKLQMHGWK